MNGRAVRGSTWLAASGGVLLAIVIFAFGRFTIGGERIALLVSDFGTATLGLAAAGTIGTVAVSLGVGERRGRIWLLIGVGVGAWALGEVAWSYIEAILGSDPYPSAADAFYLFGYLPLAIGILMGGLSYRSLMDVRPAAIVAVAVATLASLGVYFAILEPYILAADDLTPLTRAVSVFYPLGDILFVLSPAVFVVALIGRLGGGRLAWPWWAVVLGAVIAALSDTAFSYFDWRGVYETGNIVDLGWLLMYVAFATGALLERDVMTADLASADRPGRPA